MATSSVPPTRNPRPRITGKPARPPAASRALLCPLPLILRVECDVARGSIKL
uniref:Uncharacterized protein n=1 Tax=Arundo donax TaxID=35708 RepID=A0A0A8ZVG9_ARUDO